MRDYKLTSFKVYKEPESQDYFAKAVYRIEDERGIWEETYPKIYLPICKSAYPSVKSDYGITGETMTIDLGFGELPLHVDKSKKYAEIRLVKEKIHDMTISEIEKKLGYKIKIVGENE